MLTLLKPDEATNISVSIPGNDIDNLLTKEWLLTNGRGSYASSTIAGCNTRTYHGLLIGSLMPPAHRIMALSNCLEMVISKAGIFNLSTFEFPDKFAPKGFDFLKKFRRDIGAHFDYEFAKEGSFHPYDFLTVFMPKIFGVWNWNETSTDMKYWAQHQPGSWMFSIANVYISALVIVVLIPFLRYLYNKKENLRQCQKKFI